MGTSKYNNALREKIYLFIYSDYIYCTFNLVFISIKLLSRAIFMSKLKIYL